MGQGELHLSCSLCNPRGVGIKWSRISPALVSLTWRLVAMRVRFSGAIIVITIVTMSLLSAAADDQPAGVRATLRGHTESLYSVAFSPDGQMVATGSFDKTIKF